ncbi:hypothetical protein PG999_009814 [Apiospora kogelbergensis]|uniref:Uncharacterized protein n=1 Tax=Apiospora kogelbergensis TaxID=1337665 RepID=A0AAW0QVG3_9PEZI
MTPSVTISCRSSGAPVGGSTPVGEHGHEIRSQVEAIGGDLRRVFVSRGLVGDVVIQLLLDVGALDVRAEMVAERERTIHQRVDPVAVDTEEAEALGLQVRRVGDQEVSGHAGEEHAVDQPGQDDHPVRRQRGIVLVVQLARRALRKRCHRVPTEDGRCWVRLMCGIAGLAAVAILIAVAAGFVLIANVARTVVMDVDCGKTIHHGGQILDAAVKLSSPRAIDLQVNAGVGTFGQVIQWWDIGGSVVEAARNSFLDLTARRPEGGDDVFFGTEHVQSRPKMLKGIWDVHTLGRKNGVVPTVQRTQGYISMAVGGIVHGFDALYGDQMHAHGRGRGVVERPSPVANDDAEDGGVFDARERHA